MKPIPANGGAQIISIFSTASAAPSIVRIAHPAAASSAHALIAGQTAPEYRATCRGRNIILRETQGVTVAHALLNIPACSACIAIPQTAHPPGSRLYRPSPPWVIEASIWPASRCAGQSRRNGYCCPAYLVSELHPAADQHIHRSG